MSQPALINPYSTANTCAIPLPSPTCITDNIISIVVTDEIAPRSGTSIQVDGNLNMQGQYGLLLVPYIVFYPVTTSAFGSDPSKGTFIYDTTTDTFKYYNGSAWVEVGSGGGGGGVSSATGTANQVLVDGTSGTQQTGDVTLTLPQDMDTGADVQFGSIAAGAAADSSAILDLTSTSKGARLPAMTTVQRNAISAPVAGLQVYDTDLSQEMLYDGSQWNTMGGKTPYLYAYMASPQVIPNETVTQVNYNAVYSSYGIVLNTGTGVTTVPQKGNYLIHIGYDTYPNPQPAGSFCNIGYFYNGAFVDLTTSITQINEQENRFTSSVLLPFNAGDTFAPGIWCNGGGTTIRENFNGVPPFQGGGSFYNMILLST